MTFNLKRVLLILVPVLAAVMLLPVVARTAPTAPAGVTALAQDAKVELAWKPSSGATGYKVYRGTSAASITTLVGSPAGSSFSDGTVTNGSTYYYAVRATSGSGDSSPSSPAQVTPRARTCSTGNAVVVENCYPGTSAWKTVAAGTAYSGAIEGFATSTSVNAGGNVDLKVNTTDGKPYHIEIYRMGWYGGSHARLVSIIPGLTGVAQDPCQDGPGNTGLIDCSNWSTSATITTTSSWVSGVYWARLVREDNGTDNAVLFVVRNDGSTSDVQYQVPFSSYEAYNNYRGKSLYDFNSSGDTTVAGTTRAVKVSYDRPFAQTYTQDPNWFGQQDVASVGFLERNGYNTTYTTSVDVHANGGQVALHKAFISPTHDEYWSAEMRNAVTSARNSGTGLFWFGSNQMYWKIRYEASPFSGTANRVEVTYKTSQGGPVDPVSPTGTWRDPAGANSPENGLLGQQYIGDNDQQSFPLVVTAAQGKSRIWRHTDLTDLATGTTASLGQKLIGWEWNARVSNGAEPAGTQAFSSSPVTGELVQNSGASYTNGSAVTSGTYYQAASGAWVVSTGTNNWSRGLDLDGKEQGEPNADIQQATVNVLTDMGAQPTTPISGVTVDAAGAPAVTSTTPLSNATGVSISTQVRATFDRDIDPATLTSSTFKLTPAGGSAVTASVSFDSATNVATLTPSAALDANRVYTATLVGGTTGVSSWGGHLAGNVSWSFTTGAGTPPVVTARVPASGAAGVSLTAPITATFDRNLDATTVNTSSFTVSAGGSSASGAVTYDSATRTAKFTPTAPLLGSTLYTVTLTTAVKASDGTPMANTVTWQFTTDVSLTITSRTPAILATNVSPGAVVRVGFSRAVSAATVTSASFNLKTSGGTLVPATISLDASATTATITPSTSLALGSTYTATVTTAIKAADGSSLVAGSAWTFTTSLTVPTSPTVTVLTPSTGATQVPSATQVSATFDRALDPASVTGATFTLKDSAGTSVPATVSTSSSTATLVPTATLGAGKTYTAQLTTGVRATDGTPLATAVTWTFTTADCPCSLMSSLTPLTTSLPVQDGRTGAGPFTYEMGTKITVDQAVNLTAIRYWRDAGETGVHVGHLWDASGVELAQVTFQNETVSGWQRQALSSPVGLVAGQTYTVSVGLNTRFAMSLGGLSTQLTSGPLRSVVGSNGVFNATAGQFPTGSYQGSNYFVDATVSNPGAGQVPQVTARTPADGAVGVDPGTAVTAKFSTPLDPTTVSGASFTLVDAGNNAVPASVSYDSATRVATLTPTSALAAGATYTARLSTAIRSDDETPIAAAVSWSFATQSGGTAPTVTAPSPTASTTNVSPDTKVQATFSESMDPASITSATFTLTSAAGAVPATVTYVDATKTATLTPTAALSPSTVYTATVTTGARAAAGARPLSAPASWAFTTSACPCNLLGTLAPASLGNLVRDGRGGTGPWTYELGTKISVSQPAALTAIRFYKDAGETGTHVGTLWSAAGTPLATVTFAGETASGWQQQALSTPVALTPGVTYTVSVGFNTKFDLTTSGLRTQVVNGPLQSVADGLNGVYGLSAGVFPTGSWSSSNYFVDGVVR